MNETHEKPKKKPNSPDEQGWGDFLEILKHQREKVAWIVVVLAAVFLAGFGLGKFYENLMNRFDISELKTNHAKEIQDIKTEFFMKQINDMSESQQKFEKSIINSVEIKKDEK